MRNITTFFASLAIAVALGGCSKDPPSEADLEKLKAEACACQDDECRKKAEKKLRSMLEDVAEKDMGEKRMSLSIQAMACAQGLGGLMGGDEPAEK